MSLYTGYECFDDDTLWLTFFLSIFFLTKITKVNEKYILVCNVYMDEMCMITYYMII